VRRAYTSWLVVRALFELARFDLVYARRGFAGVHRPLTRHRTGVTPFDSSVTSAVCAAIATASCFYWKPVLCLQRSVCTVRLLRRYGAPARLVIGYRPVPFLSHAWVEVDGRVVNDSPAYQQRLRVLHTA
jgi:hypothetical protein